MATYTVRQGSTATSSGSSLADGTTGAVVASAFNQQLQRAPSGAAPAFNQLQRAPSAAADVVRVSFSLHGTVLSAVVAKLRATVVDVFRKHGGRFQSDMGQWHFDRGEHAALCSELRALPSVCVEPVPDAVLRAVSAPSSSASMGSSSSSSSSAAVSGAGSGGSLSSVAPSRPPRADIPLNLHPQLLEFMSSFQRTGAQYCVARNGRALVCDEMGCGKTTTAIAVAAHYRAAWPLLVICPSTLRLNWRVELLSRLQWDGLAEGDVRVINSGKDALPTRRAAAAAGGAAATASGLASGVVIISYDMVATYMERGVLRPGDFQIVIADESHSLKSPGAQRTRACLPLLQRSRHALLLSGTPALNRPIELFTQISAVLPQLFPDYRAFAVRYCAGRDMPWGWDDSGSSNLQELNGILEERVMLRRLKADVLKELPPKTRRVFNVDLIPGAVADLKAQRQRLAELNALIQGAGSEAEREALGNKKRGVLAKMFQTTGLGKLEAIVAHIFRVLQPLALVRTLEEHEEEGEGGSRAPRARAARGRGRGRGGAAASSRKGGSKASSAARGGGKRAAAASSSSSRRNLDSDDDGGTDTSDDGPPVVAKRASAAWLPSPSRAPPPGRLGRGRTLLVVEDSDDEEGGAGGHRSSGTDGEGSDNDGGFLAEEVVPPRPPPPAAAAGIIPAGAEEDATGPSSQPPRTTSAADWQSAMAHAVAKPASRAALAVSAARAATAAAAEAECIDLTQDEAAAGEGAANAGARGSDDAEECVIVESVPDAPTAAAPSASSSSSSSSSAVTLPRVKKLIVFGHHGEVLEYVQRALEAHNPPIRCLRIDGTTTPQKKHLLTKQFQTDPSVQVAVVGMTAAGVGLTFTAAHVGVFAELHWTPGILFQAEDRMHRMGQKFPVEVHYLNSGVVGVDDDIWRMVGKKLESLNAALDSNSHSAGAGGRGGAAAAPPKAGSAAAKRSRGGGGSAEEVEEAAGEVEDDILNGLGAVVAVPSTAAGPSHAAGRSTDARSFFAERGRGGSANVQQTTLHSHFQAAPPPPPHVGQQRLALAAPAFAASTSSLPLDASGDAAGATGAAQAAAAPAVAAPSTHRPHAASSTPACFQDDDWDFKELEAVEASATHAVHGRPGEGACGAASTAPSRSIGSSSRASGPQASAAPASAAPVVDEDDWDFSEVAAAEAALLAKSSKAKQQ